MKRLDPIRFHHQDARPQLPNNFYERKPGRLNGINVKAQLQRPLINQNCEMSKPSKCNDTWSDADNLSTRRQTTSTHSRTPIPLPYLLTTLPTHSPLGSTLFWSLLPTSRPPTHSQLIYQTSPSITPYHVTLLLPFPFFLTKRETLLHIAPNVPSTHPPQLSLSPKRHRTNNRQSSQSANLGVCFVWPK